MRADLGNPISLKHVDRPKEHKDWYPSTLVGCYRLTTIPRRPYSWNSRFLRKGGKLKFQLKPKGFLVKLRKVYMTLEITFLDFLRFFERFRYHHLDLSQLLTTKVFNKGFQVRCKFRIFGLDFGHHGKCVDFGFHQFEWCVCASERNPKLDFL